jgi:cytochrome c-type protein NapB
MKKLLISSAVASLLLVSSAFAESMYNKDGSVNANGLRSASLTADSQNLDRIEYVAPSPIPGQVKSFKKSFVTAPPMIPHNVAGMVPIKIGKNQCLGCHMPQSAKALGVKSIPKTHFVDNFKKGKKVGVKLAGARYNCTQCHAPQAKVDPVVQNKFNSLRK